MSHMCKRTFRFELFKAVIDKMSNFQEIAPNFTYSRNFLSIIETFQTNCFFPINFMAGTYEELVSKTSYIHPRHVTHLHY